MPALGNDRASCRHVFAPNNESRNCNPFRWSCRAGQSGACGFAGAGASLAADVEGELQVRGASVFPGYLNNPDANAEAFTSEGWFRTGDLATIDDQGNLTITGRSKDIINRGGVKYNPADIEK